MATQSETAPALSRGRIRSLATAVLIAFALGAALMFYLAWSAGWIALGENEAPQPSAAASAERISELRAAAPVVPDETSPPPPSSLAFRLEELERRLNRIDLQAEAASGNAARAEGLLIAFAARRLVERGEPLGYLENQLRLRFGNAQPNAVSTIVAAARRPVTLEDLRQELDKVSALATERPDDTAGWDRVKAELSELFVLRKASAPSPLPEKRLARAQRLLADGRVEAAAALVARLPNEPETAPWLRDARRYISTQNALDLIETAALLEPRTMIDGSGQPVRQRSPAQPTPVPVEPTRMPAPDNSVKIPEAQP